MSMSWQTVELLKAVLCMATIAWIGVIFLMQKIESVAYRRTLTGIGVGIALLGVMAYFNFGMFHWNKYPNTVHYYDIYHYHIGGKYFAELDYFDLYHATVIADQEHKKRFDHIKSLTRIRDLRSDRLIPWRDALKESDRIKAKFTPERWESFKRDIDSFQAQMPPRHWRHALSDFGFNPPPPWALMGRVVAHAFDISSLGQMILMAWVDVLILTVGFYFLHRAFGLYPLLMALTFFGVNYLQRYQHMSGSLLRLDWLAYLMIGIAALKMERPKTGGAFIAYAATLRVFPVMFLAGIGFKWLVNGIKSRSFWNDDARTLVSALITTLVIVSATLVVKPGLEGWGVWKENIVHHSQRLTVKRIALPYLFINHGRFGDAKMPKSTAYREARLEKHQTTIRVIQGVTLLLFILVCANSPTWIASIMGVMLIYTLTNPVRYYWASLVLLIPWLLTSPWQGRRLVALVALFSMMIIDFAIDSTTMEYTIHQYFASWGLGLIFLYLLITEGVINGTWQKGRDWVQARWVR
jgi:hypothetical protein